MLANCPVNLDTINSRVISSEFDDKVMHKVGEISFSTSGTAHASKPISTGLEWYHMFDLAADAITYVYPH